MKNIIAFAGSNSTDSINKQLVTYGASLLESVEVELLDLNNFELPLFGVDYEREQGIPKEAYKFLEYIKNSNGILLSLAEHNGAYTAAFKNLLDWMSRIESKTFYGKPMLLLATSTGKRGGASVLEIAKSRFPYHNAEITDVFSLPSFGDNFKNGKIVNEEFDAQLKEAVEEFQKKLEVETVK
ncbi:NADPH-dependent FMN reductase [Gaetbulibacter saemankumensis]|uniref:NADPH-dependent FMN reductase n=1 Tax=Gaetbulibacter saemankumensis TaxID=311208 RepID=UPI000416C313|nr:NAD(P)H-dependent oxidoreductase [Gaetbulibacter saemankumensis]